MSELFVQQQGLYIKSQVEKREKSVLGEGELRRRVIEKIKKLDGKQLEEILSIFSVLNKDINSKQLVDFMVKAIENAKRSYRWSHNGEIFMGYYTSNKGFYTTLLHELGHYLLKKLEIDINDEYKREDFCWLFSRLVCQILDLSYSSSKETIYKFILVLIKMLGRNKTLAAEKVFEYFLLNARHELSFLDEAALVWSDDGRPMFKK